MSMLDLFENFGKRNRLVQPLKWPGGGYYVAKDIVTWMNISHSTYVEPYAGGLACLLVKNPYGVAEVVNDLNGALSNFWSVLEDPKGFDLFYRIIQGTTFDENRWHIAHECLKNNPGTLGRIDWAVEFFINCRMSLGGQGKRFTSITKDRQRRGMQADVAAWLTCIEGLPEVHERLKKVLILNRDALDVIDEFDQEGTLFYCDPPFLPDTRTGMGQYGQFEMSVDQHESLLRRLCKIKGKFLLSGYSNTLYNSYGWPKIEIAQASHMGMTKVKTDRVHCVWRNYG
jgi:DNA adenine methylase